MKFKIEPNILAANIGEKLINENLVLLNLNLAYSNADSSKIDYSVIFRAKEVKLSGFGVVHLGITSCKFYVGFKNGVITNYTKPRAENVKYTSTDSNSSNSESSFNPKLSLAKESDLELGGVKKGKGKSHHRNAVLESTEYPIIARFYKTSVEWEIDKPDAKMMFREYISGNFDFFVNVEKNDDLLSGTIKIKPLPFEIFSTNKRKVSKLKSGLANFVLHMTNDLPYNKNGQTFKYSEINGN